MVDFIAHRTVAIIVKVVARCAIAIIANVVICCIVIVNVSIVSRHAIPILVVIDC